ncbi:MAG TPA: bifunctional shikimate kinase/3-dehydroquinate synthase [Solirubrobacteraceae bacterium]|nr:bifunctional shikimate kinase/3-dehydroquinate synthase [Solirubrobacteraceae bacterium]
MAAALRPALVFIGFMAAGKSTAAREVAAELGVPVRDSDRLLQERFGEPIQSFFDREGEPAFRAAEEALVCELLERADGEVVALGGGALGSERVRAALARHSVVLVDVDLDTAWARAAEGGRPLARDRDRFAALYAERAATYEAAARAIVPGRGRGTAARAATALRDRPDGLTLLWATAASGDYPVWVGAGAARRAPWPASGRRLAVTDGNVAAAQPTLLEGAETVETIPAGEEHKTLATAERLWTALVRAGATRADHVVGVGGGVVGDLAGFVAATYQRGVPVVHVPTTIVAQVDSAYGGKTGVDLPEAKNYVGAYHQPAGVLVDPGALDTLPPAERAAGYAEVVKTALIAGGPLWDRVAAGAPVDEDIVVACARAKLRVVAADERDAGARQVLNLGHTVGHAIETVTGYARYRHGEAVGLGLLAALRLSGQDALRAQVRELLAAAGLPIRLDGADPAAVVAATARDKKRVGGEVPFVLVRAAGDVRHGEPVAAADLDAAVRELAT